ncbi:Uncharacterized protein Fot_13938 [Forsythia ovata]|uniref:Uncharacterized protein n=1 Tax=Forsythia ovata TaxID=205694 RepID=A0ABD1W5E6_9LAMI
MVELECHLSKSAGRRTFPIGGIAQQKKEANAVMDVIHKQQQQQESGLERAPLVLVQTGAIYADDGTLPCCSNPVLHWGEDEGAIPLGDIFMTQVATSRKS